MQGDREKQLGMGVSPLMDRKNKGGITRSQVRLPDMNSSYYAGPNSPEIEALNIAAT